jgi:hypothetical protein
MREIDIALACLVCCVISAMAMECSTPRQKEPTKASGPMTCVMATASSAMQPVTFTTVTGSVESTMAVERLHHATEACNRTMVNGKMAVYAAREWFSIPLAVDSMDNSRTIKYVVLPCLCSKLIGAMAD